MILIVMKCKTIFGIIAVLLLLSGCTGKSIADIKTPENVGKTVVLKGTAENSIKIGQLSGYTLKDAAGDTIGVSTTNLPNDGDKVTARGILIKDTLLGYYIKIS
jgi:hypothetical protein